MGGGDAVWGVFSALPSDLPSGLASGSLVGVGVGSAGLASSLTAADLADFCAVDVTLAGFAGLIGMRGMAGTVAVRVCEAAVVRAGGGGIDEEGVVGWVELASEGGCEEEGVSTSEPAALVEA